MKSKPVLLSEKKTVSNIVLTQSIMILFPVTTRQRGRISLTLSQNSIGGNMPMFPNNITWETGSEPVPPVKPYQIAAYEFKTRDGGTTWTGVQKIAPATLPLVLDRFIRANSTSSLGSAEIGGAWTQVLGTWGISNYSAYLQTRSGDSKAVIDTGAANHTVFCDITPSHSQAQSGLVFRYADDNNFMLFHVSNCQANPNTATIWKVVSGTFTQIKSINLNPSYFVGCPFRAGISCSGNTITIYINGVSVGTQTESANNTNTKVGLRHNDANASAKWGDLVAW